MEGTASPQDVPRQCATEGESSVQKSLAHSLAIILFILSCRENMFFKPYSGYQAWRILLNHCRTALREGKVIDVSLLYIGLLHLPQAPEDVEVKVPRILRKRSCCNRLGPVASCPE